MKPFLSLLLAPALSFAAVSGTVTLLDGTPIAGALLQTSKDTATSSASGSFTMARAAGITSRLGKTVPVTSHLTLENGHPRLDFSGFDLSGRTQRSSLGSRLQPPGRAEGSLISGAGRSAEATDTLRVYWKGKRLTVLPVPSDTAVTLRIDTAWKHDFDIPWNPTITYGSLFDSRDGQTYRTVTIGTQTWMAENLNIDTLHSICDQDSIRCARAGRIYPQVYLTRRNPSGYIEVINNRRGICMAGWHIPTSYQWDTLSGRNANAGPNLKSIQGWDNGGHGLDLNGFRAIPATVYRQNSSTAWYRTNLCAYFWTSSISSSEYMSYVDFQYNYNYLRHDHQDDTHSGTITHFSIRCIKDTP